MFLQFQQFYLKMFSYLILDFTVSLLACVCSVSSALQPTDYSSPGSSVHALFRQEYWSQQITNTGVLGKWWRYSISYFKWSPRPRYPTHLLHFLEWQVGSLTTAPPGKPLYLYLDINYFVISVGNAPFKYAHINNIYFLKCLHLRKPFMYLHPLM